jgi:hypothetical protein
MKVSVEYWWKDTDRGELECWRQTYHSATLSTINLTWATQGPNPASRGERQATDHLTHGTALETRI